MSWENIIKQQERTFIITGVDWDMSIESNETDEAVLLWMVNSVTAKELDIVENDDKEDIEDELSSWISDSTGWLHSGFTWHEVTADGKKVEW